MLMETKEQKNARHRIWKAKKKQDTAYREKLNEYARQYYLKKSFTDPNFKKNKCAIASAYNKRNRAKKAEYARKYRFKNKERIAQVRRKWNRIYEANKKKTDVNFKITRNLRTRLKNALAHNLKSAKTLQLLGCTVEQLRAHLEARFTSGMSWSNYGEWHIDHIKPCSSYDMSDPVQQAACFHYTNLQPLWAIDNLKKGDAV